jgi:hypothetical protein
LQPLLLNRSTKDRDGKLTLFPLFFIKSIECLPWENETGDMRSVHGKLAGNEIDGRGGKWLTIPPKLPCLKIFSDEVSGLEM